MTQTIDDWTLVIPDEVTECFVYASYPEVCPGVIAEWMVAAGGVLTEYPLCDACKERWQSYGTVTSARLI